MKDLATELQRRRAEHLYRSRRLLDGPQGAEVTVDGRRCLAFCTNDYLGLANDPAVVEALKRGADTYGVGSGAAHLVLGHSRAHHALEEELADFLGRSRALLFSTGYMANLGVISALLGQGDLVLQDRLNHASLLDAGRLSQARVQRYAHGRAEELAARLEKPAGREVLVASDGVFSMDGDLAPIPALAAACARAGAWLMIDDAHGVGVLGASGRGSLEHFGLGIGDVPILMGTLGKALGTAGAFVAGDETLIETLIQHARTYVYTTAPSPALAEATRTSLRLVREEGWRRDRLRGLTARFREGAAHLGLPLSESASPIQPLLLGSARTAMELSQALFARGIIVTAIRPPTVPKGTSRLRITLSAAHREEHVDRLLEALAEVAIPLGGWDEVVRKQEADAGAG